jgi:hypothetical protein
MLRITAGPELRSPRIALGQQLALAQQTLQLTRHGRPGIDQDDRRRQHLSPAEA